MRSRFRARSWRCGFGLGPRVKVRVRVSTYIGLRVSLGLGLGLRPHIRGVDFRVRVSLALASVCGLS